jgi:hypothetical protein
MTPTNARHPLHHQIRAYSQRFGSRPATPLDALRQGLIEGNCLRLRENQEASNGVA